MARRAANLASNFCLSIPPPKELAEDDPPPCCTFANRASNSFLFLCKASRSTVCRLGEGAPIDEEIGVTEGAEIGEAREGVIGVGGGVVGVPGCRRISGLIDKSESMTV